MNRKGALRLVPDPNATLLFVGYQAAGTTGRRILDGEREVKIMGQWVPVRCRIERIGSFSAHADWQEILDWLRGMPNAPRQTFLTHGEPAAAEAMAAHIREAFAWPATVPIYGQRVELV